MKKIQKKQFGFTLIELLVVMGLFSILLVVIMDMFLAILHTQSKSISASNIAQDSQFILQKFTNDINNANTITAPAVGSTNSTLQFILYGVPQTYQWDNNNLKLINNYGTTLLNGFNDDITNITFTHIGNLNGKDSVQMKFTIKSKISVNNINETQNYQITSGIR
ncbi:MAG: type II secretion system protein [bacterium]|nr:type II secretion system protein [bacterium]